MKECNNMWTENILFFLKEWEDFLFQGILGTCFFPALKTFLDPNLPVFNMIFQNDIIYSSGDSYV